MTEFPEKRREAQRDSSPPGFKVIQPSHPRSTWKKYGVKTGDILPPQKGVLREDSDWRESLTFKQALYPYRVGEDMHNPSKMHMNFPSSNSSRLNSSQWINYEYCMYWIAEDQIEFTVKKKAKQKQIMIIFWDWTWKNVLRESEQQLYEFVCKHFKSFKMYRVDVSDISEKNSESTLWSWNCLLLQSLFRNGKISVNFQPFFDSMNLRPSCTTWLPQVSGWCSVAWNKQIEKGTSWHLTLARMRLTASLPASYDKKKKEKKMPPPNQKMGVRAQEGRRGERRESVQMGKRWI